MRTCSAPLLDLLTTQRQYFMADLFTFTLIDGTILRYTSAEVDLLVDGRLFLGYGIPVFERESTRAVRGLEVDSLEVTIYAKASHTVVGVPWLEALSTGALDGARFELERAFAAGPATGIVGTLLLFSGRVSDSTTGTTSGKITVRSDLELLNIRMPKNLYQPGCLNILFDSGCGLNKTSYAVSSSLLAGSDRSQLVCGLAQPADYFTLGEVRFTSGANTGVSRSVRAYSAGLLTLSYPLPKPITIGDAFTVWPGCDGQQSTCQTTYANQARYRAFPFVPVPEAML